MNTNRIKSPFILLFALFLVFLSGCANSSNNQKDSSASQSGNLTFQIWDIDQKPAMEALAKAYTEKNPDTHIEIQVTNWGEYWTKLEASAESNTMPDIFWMHTNEFMKYAIFQRQFIEGIALTGTKA